MDESLLLALLTFKKEEDYYIMEEEWTKENKTVEMRSQLAVTGPKYKWFRNLQSWIVREGKTFTCNPHRV
jgi:hypothetical protein